LVGFIVSFKWAFKKKTGWVWVSFFTTTLTMNNEKLPRSV